VSRKALRRLLLVVGAVGIPLMIVSSIADNNDAALAAGILTGGAALCLLLVTTVADDGAVVDDEVLARSVEQRVTDLVATGADESRVRALVSDAVRLGRSRAPTT
jgi:hypothetical protein